jgi:hypothetical protein
MFPYETPTVPSGRLDVVRDKGFTPLDMTIVKVEELLRS